MAIMANRVIAFIYAQQPFDRLEENVATQLARDFVAILTQYCKPTDNPLTFWTVPALSGELDDLQNAFLDKTSWRKILHKLESCSAFGITDADYFAKRLADIPLDINLYVHMRQRKAVKKCGSFLSLSISAKICRIIPQDRLDAFFHKACNLINATYACYDMGHPPMLDITDTPFYKYSKLPPYQYCQFANLLLPGCYWKQWITRTQIDVLGGLSAVMNTAPCYSANIMETKHQTGIWLQTTKSIYESNRYSRLAFRKFSRLLLPEPSLHKIALAIRRGVMDEHEVIPLTENEDNQISTLVKMDEKQLNEICESDEKGLNRCPR